MDSQKIEINYGKTVEQDEKPVNNQHVDVVVLDKDNMRAQDISLKQGVPAHLQQKLDERHARKSVKPKIDYNEKIQRAE